MSSLPDDVSSLSGLSACAEYVDKIEQRVIRQGEGPIKEDDFMLWKKALNSLQVCCSNHPGVVDARARWYECLLFNFETYVVSLIEKGVNLDIARIYWGSTTDKSPIFRDARKLIEEYLRRHYLKDHFPKLFNKALELYDRLSRAVEDEEIRDNFVRKAVEFRERLLQGKF